MFQSLIELFPVEWRGFLLVLTAPIAWIPGWTTSMLSAIGGQDPLVAVALIVTLAMPALLLIAGMWTTMLSIYTIPFRSGRMSFITAILMTWWDAGRVAWIYWSGFARLGVAVAGWMIGAVKFVLLTLRNTLVGVVRSPFQVLDWTSRRYFKPGVPWLAFLILLVWSGVEATVFSFTLQPTLTEVFGGLTGFDPNPAIMVPLLWLFLFMLVAGSFACIQVLNEAIRSRRVGEIIQMALVESAVMFFEVIFLYRELIDAITPWLFQQSGGQLRLGIASTILLASFGWIGVRGMSWFLFGRFGTPALLAVLGRQTISQDAPDIDQAPPITSDMWRAPIDALKGDVAWFQVEGKKLFELLTLPVMQVLAAVVNFAMVTVTGRPAFRLPFNSLEEMLAVNPFAHAHAPAPILRPSTPASSTTQVAQPAQPQPVAASGGGRRGAIPTPRDPIPRAAL